MDFDYTSMTAVELQLDADLWKAHRNYLVANRHRGQSIPDVYECGADPGDGRGRRVFAFKPGDSQLVPKNIAQILIDNSRVWQLLRDDDGNVLNDHDHDNPQMPLLRNLGERTPQLQQPQKQVGMAPQQCPICEEVFESQDEFKDHIEEAHIAVVAKAAQRGPGRPRKQPINKPDEGDDEE